MCHFSFQHYRECVFITETRPIISAVINMKNARVHISHRPIGSGGEVRASVAQWQDSAYLWLAGFHV